MKKGFIDRMLGLIGADESEEMEQEGSEEEDRERERERSRDERPEPRGRKKVVPLPSTRQTRLIIMEPSSFNDVQQIADHLKSRRPVIVNMGALGKDEAKRVLDFVSGATYALDGTMQKVGEGIFLLTSRDFEVSIDAREEGRERGRGPFDR